MSRGAGWPAIGLVLLVAACAEPAVVDPGQIPIAVFGESSLSLAEFQNYLEANLVADDGPLGSEQEAAAVKSRLLDAFVEERLLLGEAERREIAISDLEVEAYLNMSGVSEADQDASATRSDWDEAKRRLKIEKLLELAVSELPPLADDALSATGQGDAPGPTGRRLRLRSLMLESTAVAERVSTDIRRGRVTFNEAVVAYATAPEQGQPIELSWDSLSEEHRAVLSSLKPGQVSQPLDVGGGTYLFLVEAWLRKGRLDPAAEAEGARRRLERQNQAEALRALVSKLRKSAAIRIHFANLPFTYVEEDSVHPTGWNRVNAPFG